MSSRGRQIKPTETHHEFAMSNGTSDLVIVSGKGNKQPYVWLGPKVGPGDVMTLDKREMRQLRDALTRSLRVVPKPRRRGEKP